jgi:hypothetical protein
VSMTHTQPPCCRECYEVRCKDKNFRDGFGETLKREDACLDASASVIVKIVDRCVCGQQRCSAGQQGSRPGCCVHKSLRSAE